jgi:predicted 3-demethylubiquinone-9 3-methyltransferase (glyoxalase superfamily)
MTPKLTPMLWFETGAEDAAHHYLQAFDDGKILNVMRHGKDGSGPEGSAFVVTVLLGGVQFELLNAGPMFKPTEANSYVIYCETQAEVDRLWDHMGEGGVKQPCGWLKDKWGFSWQIVPRVLMQIFSGQDEAAKSRAMSAIMEMTKLDVAAIEAAAKG